MILGYSLLIIALVATVAANVLFVLSRREGKEGLAKIAKTSVSVALAGIHVPDVPHRDAPIRIHVRC